MPPSSAVLNVADRVAETRERIKGKVIQTPCIQSRRVVSSDRTLIYKCENFQTTGSFKIRGATAKLSSLPTNVPVVTASSGNHGIACASAAQMTGHNLYVVLPDNVAKAKLSKIEELGAQPILIPGDSGLAERHARSLAAQEGYTYVSPYNDLDVIAGQGMIALELLEQLSQIDRVYVSMGGGGLISGIGSVLKSIRPHTEIVGVSAQNSAALASSITAGHVVDVEHHPTLADGCAGGMDHDAVTFPIACEVIDRVVECSESNIENALRCLAWTENMMVEGAAALALAAYLADSPSNTKGTSVVVLCGANFDRKTLQPIICDGE